MNISRIASAFAAMMADDGSAATHADVVTHYNRARALGLTTDQQRDLVEYLKSL